MTTKIEYQKVLEQLFSKNQLMTRIKNEFLECKEIDFKKIIKSAGIEVNFGITVLAQMALHKRCSLPVLAGIMRPHAKTAQKAVDDIKRCAEIDLMDWSTPLQVFIVKFNLSADTQQEIDMYQYPLPMVVRPLMVESNKDSGYFLNKASVILRDNHHENDVCLDHINRANQVQYSINMDVVKFIKNTWRNIDKAKEGENKQDFEKRKRAFEKYDKTSKEVIDRINTITDHFYLTHRYDKRGRVYCQGYHVNYQGAPWNKACVEFFNKEVTL